MLRGERRGFARGIDAKELLEQQKRADAADDCRWISHRASEGRQRKLIRSDAGNGAESLGSRAERGNVDRRAGENPEHSSRIKTGKPADERSAGGA